MAVIFKRVFKIGFHGKRMFNLENEFVVTVGEGGEGWLESLGLTCTHYCI